MYLAETLQKELLARGWTTNNLVAQTSVAYGTTYRALHGIGNITVRNASRLLAGLDLEFVIVPISPACPPKGSEGDREAPGLS